MTAAATKGTDRMAPTSVAPRQAVAVAIAADQSAVPTLRRLARQVARHWGLPDTVVDALALITSELVTNAIVHSGSREVQLLLTADQEHADLHVRDHGGWHEPHRHPDTLPTGGRGLALVRAYSELHLVTEASGTTATARLALNPPATGAS